MPFFLQITRDHIAGYDEFGTCGRQPGTGCTRSRLGRASKDNCQTGLTDLLHKSSLLVGIRALDPLELQSEQDLVGTGVAQHIPTWPAPWRAGRTVDVHRPGIKIRFDLSSGRKRSPAHCASRWTPWCPWSRWGRAIRSVLKRRPGPGCGRNPHTFR